MSHWLLLRVRKIEYALYHLRLRAVSPSAALHNPSIISERSVTHSSETFHLTPSSSVLHPDLRNIVIGRAGCQRAYKTGVVPAVLCRNSMTVGVDARRRQFRGEVAVGGANRRG